MRGTSRYRIFVIPRTGDLRRKIKILANIEMHSAERGRCYLARGIRRAIGRSINRADEYLSIVPRAREVMLVAFGFRVVARD